MPGKILTLLLALLLLSGCATQRMPFNESDFAGLTLEGNKTISGELFLIDQLEEKQVGDMAEVTLEPVTPYSSEWYEVSYLGNRSIQKPDPRYNRFVRRTRTDKDGAFAFTGVAPGEYYLSGTVNWKAATCSGKLVQKKVPVSLKIAIAAADEKIEVPLTKEFISPSEICGLYNQSDWEKVPF